MDITIKKARVQDAAQILNLYQTSFLEPDSILEDPNTLTTIEDQEIEIKDHSRGNNVYLTAWDDNQIVGILIFTGGLYQKNQHGGCFEILIRKESRGQGVGRQLIKQLLSWTKDNKIKRIEVEVWANNKPAIELYKKFGFKVEGTKVKAYKIKNKFINSLLMARLSR